MLRYLLSFLVMCVVLGYLVVSAGQFTRSFSKSETVRTQYGEYGKKLIDLRKGVLPQEPKSATATSMEITSVSTQENTFSSNGGTNVNSRLLNSPYGTHGNNYSLYDINSPSGQMGKF